MNATTKELGQVLRKKRQAQLLSLQDLSGIMNIAKSLLSKYELGHRNISRNHFPVIVDYLNGEYDRGIMDALLENIRKEYEKKYERLTGKKGLALWE
ncbi:TPA: helix-turn-helix domain-containing protein [Bacillus cereus]|nr:helix-turn-helix domain-containing protein [Bacillus cereus]